MAVTITRSMSNGLAAKIVAHWGTEAEWWQWAKLATRAELTHIAIRAMEAEVDADRDARRAAITVDAGEV